MYRYFYEVGGETLLSNYGSFGQAIDAAMMDFSSGSTKPIKVQDYADRDLLDYHDLHWLYSRTWGAEYDRATGAVTPRIRNTQEAADLLGMSVRMVQAHITAGNLTATKKGRDYLISTDELERFKTEKRPAHRPKKAHPDTSE